MNLRRLYESKNSRSKLVPGFEWFLALYMIRLIPISVNVEAKALIHKKKNIIATGSRPEEQFRDHKLGRIWASLWQLWLSSSKFLGVVVYV